MPEKSALEERLTELQEEYSKTKDNKATNKAVGILRHKIAETKKMIGSIKNAKGTGYFVRKSGDATVALLGFPNVGKSSLINLLANTKSKTAPYAFTTISIVPGTMLYKGAHIQIFDMPGVIEGAHLGLGNGKAVLGAMRVSDLILFVVDIGNTGQLGMLLEELKALGIHVNGRMPRVRITESDLERGIEIELNKSGIKDGDLLKILSSFGIYHAKVRIEEPVDIDDLLSIIAGNTYYMKAIAALNKIDLNADYERIANELSKSCNIEVIPISASQKGNIELLKERIYENLGIMTVYLKPKSKEERAMSIVLDMGSRVIDAANKLHTELADQINCAYVTGPSSKFARQKVGAMHVLEGGDTITFIKLK
jgi:hypothetical protein